MSRSLRALLLKASHRPEFDHFGASFRERPSVRRVASLPRSSSRKTW
jgi:hypothetical protein